MADSPPTPDSGEPVIRITVLDLLTGEEEIQELPAGDYCITTTEPCYVHHVAGYRTGTAILTVKGRVARPRRG